jgi:hypothetical protein
MREVVAARAATVLMVSVLVSCSHAAPGRNSLPTLSPTVRSPAPSKAPADVTLVASTPALRRQCRTAALRLGFSVPCPTRVVVRAGTPLACTPSPIPTTLPLCVGPEHDFFLEWNGFDVPATFVGVDGKAVGHVIIHGGLARDSPPRPCIGGVVIGAIVVLKSRAIEYRCPPDSPLIERVATHGEGAYTSHVLVIWRHDGVDYLVSSHGYAAASITLMNRLATSVVLVTP